MIRIQATAGAKLEPFVHTFLDEDGTVITLTGYTGEATSVTPDGTTGTVSGSVNGAAGTVTCTLPATATASSGVLDVQLWAGNGTYRLASPIWRVLLAETAGAAPSI